ncbi:hypothetical protein N7G274_010209 [Stereocaulon virgatum]|uniref:SET domain-containing protein n=1 Tax=Stereocaulon virgatum TaxID=373712 RepID=A0ABR3ZYC8_9LECA
MDSSTPQWLHWKQKGDTKYNNGNYLRAIKCHAPSEENERVWWLTAKALYGLRRWRECAACLEKIGGLYAETGERREVLERCRVRVREEEGEYDWGGMIEGVRAGDGKGDLDCADYVGGIEVRPCAVEGHGRGLFTTRDVEAGELLLCEKAFGAAFAKDEEEGEGDEETMRVRAELAMGVFVKLVRNPSLREGFGELFAGDEVDEQRDLKGEVVVDDTFVQSRINYNAFAFPLLTSTSHQQILSHPAGISTDANNRGIWLRASFINHSCYPLVRRSFIGDMMNFRAQADIPKDTELKFGYISCLEDVETRTEMLAKYGFRCECQVCIAERATSPEKFKRRKEITKMIIELFEKSKAVGLHTYLDLLGQIGETYIVSPTIEPRHAVVVPIINIITGCQSSALHLQVIQLVQLLLINLGFEFRVTQDNFRVLRWGYLIDELVMALADLRDAYAALAQTELSRDAESVAKKCYLIMCGEELSWEAAYGAQSERRKGDKGGSEARWATEGKWREGGGPN